MGPHPKGLRDQGISQSRKVTESPSFGQITVCVPIAQLDRALPS